MKKLSLILALSLSLVAGSKDDEYSVLRDALERAEKELAGGQWDQARQQIDRALERDSKSLDAWRLRARWAEGTGDKDELVYALHRQRRLAIAQKAPKARLEELRKQLEAADPIAPDLLDMNFRFVRALLPLAEQYEKEKRPHSAIRVHQEILALDPERSDSAAAIQRMAAAPDPSLAETAKPKNLLEGISEEWMRQFDAEHASWDTRAKLQRDNYTTYTDAGYEVLVRAGEAMEQMNAFYRQFFQYGSPEDKKSVSRIDLNIFKSREEYLKLGIGPPVEWSAGHFTGGAVECYIGPGGFEEMTGVLFHEAAHQFVSLATSASGWLNEGLASFFEGTRILANGTVIMNLPANHRLFPLVDRMEKGWMADHRDGLDPKNSNAEPAKAPTFRIVLENKYEWGPPWYAPTWGVVYFCYNYQDPVDGRFIYRDAFGEFINSSGGRSGEGAVENFEKVVLANPKPPTKGVDFSKASERVTLPTTAEELNEVWKDWMTKLRDEQRGTRIVPKPYLSWARHAVTRKDYWDASEHFEKGLVETPNDVILLFEFAELLGKEFKNADRASKLVLQGLRLLENAEKPDEKAIRQGESMLAKWDPKRQTLERIHRDLWAASKGIAQRYLAADLPLMAMDVSWRLGNDLNAPELFEVYEAAARKSLKTLTLWQIAYNEKNLEGWASAGTNFQANGTILDANFGAFSEEEFQFQFLTYDTITSGDYSFEAEVQAERGRVNFAGLVFGKKSANSFHGLLLFPGRHADESREILERQGTVDLTSFFGPGASKIWRHNPVDTSTRGSGSTTGLWHKLRIDVSGPLVDVWFDGEYVVTQEFSSWEVLRGSFGLITGPGQSRFRNVRYLARPARDPGARIERTIRMERLAAPGQPIGGSFLGLVPPFPKTRGWVQGERSRWDEKGPVPTLLVLWNPDQNNKIPIDAWLRHMAEKHADIGLEIVAICGFDEVSKIREYLKARSFPGAVGVDSRPYSGGMGDSFETFSIAKFFLPRLLLLDLDHKVVWEGDPGFAYGAPWEPGQESYIDAPLEELVSKRKLRELVPWRKSWEEKAKPALHEGDLKTALPILRGAEPFDENYDPDVFDAKASLALVETTLSSIESVGHSLAREEAEAAIEALPVWTEILGKPLTPAAKNSLKPFLGSAASKAWSQAKTLAKQTIPKLKGKDPLAPAQDLLSKLAELPGALSQELSTELEASIASGSVENVERVLNNAERLPARWLARNYFRW